MTTPRLGLGLALFLAGLVTTLAVSDTPSTSPTAPAPATIAATTSTPTTDKVEFYGIADHATRIVYIIDHSGSMLDNFYFLREEVKHSINNLTPGQSFNVVMVSEEAQTVLPSGQLVRATAEAKKELTSKINEYQAQSQNCDILVPYQQAFEEAFKCKPELIYFLTDGDFDPKLIDVVEKLNKENKVRINTLAFVNNEPSYKEQLQALAKKNGGTYKFVDEKDLGR